MTVTWEKVLYTMPQFVKLTNKFKLFKDAIRTGDSVMIEYMYIDFLPYWQATGKTNYVAMVLQQVKDLYWAVPGWLLQHIREEQFQGIYKDMDKNKNPLPSERWTK